MKYMGKGDGKRRWEKELETEQWYGGSDGRQTGRGRVEIISETGIGGLRRWPVGKGEPGLRIVEGGGCSNQFGGNVRRFVSVYETKLKLKNQQLSPREENKENIQSYFRHGHKCARGTILAGTDVNGTSKASTKTKKPRRFVNYCN